MSKSFWLAAFVATILGADEAYAAVIRRIAGPGVTVPGIPGAKFSAAEYPAFDSDGNVLYLGRIAGPQVTWENQEGFWRYEAANSQTELVMRIAEPLPSSTDGAAIKNWFTFGHGLVYAGLTGPTVDARSDIALVDVGKREARTIARQGQAVPGLPAGTQFDHVGTGWRDHSDQYTVFEARLVGPGINVENDSGLWIDDGNTLRQVVREGDSVPGHSAAFREFNSEGVDSLGRAVFTGHFYSEDPLSKLYESGIYVVRNGNLQELIRTGAQAPGLPMGVDLKSVHSTRVNSSGHLVVHVELSGPGMEHGFEQAVYVERGNGPELIAREGEQIPGLSGVVWSGSSGYFPARPDALMSVRDESGGEWQLLSTGWERLPPNPRLGEPAPGTNTEFGHIYWSLANALGRRVFSIELIDEHDSALNDRSLWADDENGVLQLVLREGDLVETQPGVFQPVNLDNLHSQLYGFSDRGEILFTAHDGVYVATVNAVPEPGTFVLTIAGGVVLVWIVARTRR